MALFLEEEEEKEPDLELLNTLRELSTQETDYFAMTPERRNALNTWFNEVKDMLFAEMLEGNFGSQILLDTFFILCFEVGRRIGAMGLLETQNKEEG